MKMFMGYGWCTRLTEIYDSIFMIQFLKRVKEIKVKKGRLLLKMISNLY